MDLINSAATKYQEQLAAQKAQDPLAQLAGQVGLKVNTLEAEQKLRVMGDTIAQQAAQTAQVKTADAVDKAKTAYKQNFFQGAV